MRRLRHLWLYQPQAEHLAQSTDRVAEKAAGNAQTTPQQRRGPNQIPEGLEEIIRELLGRGWGKSRIARTLRLNRRTVIRVARQNAQKPN